MTCPSSLRLDDRDDGIVVVNHLLFTLFIIYVRGGIMWVGIILVGHWFRTFIPCHIYCGWRGSSFFVERVSNEPNSSAFYSLTNSLHIHHLPDNHHRVIFIENSCFFYSPNYPRQLEVSTPIWNQYLFAMIGSSTISILCKYCASDNFIFAVALPLNHPIVVAFCWYILLQSCCFLSLVVPVLSRGI